MRIERAYIFFFGGLFVAGSAQAAPPLSPDGSTEAIINMIEARLPQLASSPNGIVNAIFSAGILQAANAADELLPPPSDKLRADLKDMAILHHSSLRSPGFMFLPCMQVVYSRLLVQITWSIGSLLPGKATRLKKYRFQIFCGPIFRITPKSAVVSVRTAITLLQLWVAFVITPEALRLVFKLGMVLFGAART